jgi:hypothetical protein
MRIRTVLTAAVLAALAAVPLAGVASALPPPTDRDCRDFASQAAAQSALRSHSGDPARLDPDHNGVACEDYFKTAVPGAVLAANGAVPGAVPAANSAVPGAVPAAAPVMPVMDAPAPPAPPAPPAALVPPPGGSNEVAVKTGAPADAAVRTVPEHQILVAPHGAAATGDGSTAPLDRSPVVLLAGGLGAAVALGGGYRLARRSR